MSKRTDEQLLMAPAREALSQIEKKQCCTELLMEGYPTIRKLGIAFKGQQCLIGDEDTMKPRQKRKS